MGNLRSGMIKAFIRLWYQRKNLPILNFPFPWIDRSGGFFLVYPDEMGLNIFLSWRKNRNQSELGEGRFLSRFLQKGMACVDVGANQGKYSVLFSKKSGRLGRVFAFEPVDSEFRKLKTNLLLNGCRNVETEKIALGKERVTGAMFVCVDGHPSRSSFRFPPDEVEGRREQEIVEVFPLDLWLSKRSVKNVDLLKIDAEGSELDILEGAEALLRELRPFMLIELADVATAQFGYKASKIIEYLKGKGYMPYEFLASGLIKCLEQKSEYRENIFAVPAEKLGCVSGFISQGDK